MSAARRHKKHHHEEHENHERWLVSGYDMMTLLFAVFVVLFAISSTNISKVKLLEQSLQDAFSGPVLSGGKNMMKTGATSDGTDQATPQPPLPSLSPTQAVAQAMQSEESAEDQAKQAQAEERGFQDLKKRIDKLAEEAGLADKLSTTVTPDGLKIRLVTDGVLFDSGSAVIRSQGRPTLEEIGRIIAQEGGHPVKVEGHTDDQPIHTSQYPSNWQLSGARAAAVVQSLGAAGVSGKRMSLAGYAAEHPVAGNTTPTGRAKNRRVEIILTRLHGATPSHGGDTQ
jgi:chemotaxis protein MotB